MSIERLWVIAIERPKCPLHLEKFVICIAVSSM